MKFSKNQGSYFILSILLIIGVSYYFGYESRIFGVTYFLRGLRYDLKLDFLLASILTLSGILIYRTVKGKSGFNFTNGIEKYKNKFLVSSIFLAATISTGSGFQNNTFRVFNILLFGADPTFTNDATVAVQSAINACDNSGGGTVYGPNGIYKIAGPLITSDNNGNNVNSQIYIPAHPASNGHHSSIIFQGESANMEFFNYFGSALPTLVDGCIFRSTLSSASGTRPSVFATEGAAGVGTYNVEFITFRDMIVETYTNSGAASPVLSGFNMYDAATFSAYRVSVRLDCDLVSSQTPGEIAGIITGHRGDNGPNILSECMVYGYKYAYMVGEHSHFISSYAIGNVYGLTVMSNFYQISGKFLVHACNHGVWFQDRTVMGIARDASMAEYPINMEMEMEVDSGATFPFWFATVDQVIDSSSLGAGPLLIYSVLGGSGAIQNTHLNIKGNAYHLNVIPLDAYGVKSSRIQNLGTINESLYGNNVYWDSAGGVFRYINTNTASALQLSGGDIILTSFPSGTANASVGATNNWEKITGSNGHVNLSAYGTGAVTGTFAAGLSLDASGNLIEVAPPLNSVLTTGNSSGIELKITGTNTTHPLFDVGGFNVQPTAVNDITLNDNGQAVSGTFKYLANGFYEGAEMFNGQISLRVANSGTAGATISSIVSPFMLDNTNSGSIYLGGNISYGGGSNGSLLTVTGTTIFPTGTTVTTDLGTSSKAWRDIYFSHTIGESAMGSSTFTGTNVTSATASGSDEDFQVTIVVAVGGAAGTIADISFGRTWTSRPHCTISDANSGTISLTTGIAANATSTSNFEIAGTILAGTAVYNCHCGQ